MHNTDVSVNYIYRIYILDIYHYYYFFVIIIILFFLFVLFVCLFVVIVCLVGFFFFFFFFFWGGGGARHLRTLYGYGFTLVILYPTFKKVFQKCYILFSRWSISLFCY